LRACALSKKVAVARLQIDAEVGVRAIEWVDIRLLREGMSTLCPLRPMIALIALTGTDYSRNLPLVKPKKLWGIMGSIQSNFHCFTESGFVDVRGAMDMLVASIYRQLFRQQCRGDDFDGVMKSLGGSRLSNRYKQLLPSNGRALCTLKNANFIFRYWTGQSVVGAELREAQFGFCVRPDGGVDWDESII